MICAAGMDLCLESDHGCEHICESSPGSFHCLCLPGYTLNDDGKTCAGEYKGHTQEIKSNTDDKFTQT